MNLQARHVGIVGKEDRKAARHQINGGAQWIRSIEECDIGIRAIGFRDGEAIGRPPGNPFDARKQHLNVDVLPVSFRQL